MIIEDGSGIIIERAFEDMMTLKNNYKKKYILQEPNQLTL